MLYFLDPKHMIPDDRMLPNSGFVRGAETPILLYTKVPTMEWCSQVKILRDYHHSEKFPNFGSQTVLDYQVVSDDSKTYLNRLLWCYLKDFMLRRFAQLLLSSEISLFEEISPNISGSRPSQTSLRRLICEPRDFFFKNGLLEVLPLVSHFKLLVWCSDSQDLVYSRATCF